MLDETSGQHSGEHPLRCTFKAMINNKKIQILSENQLAHTKVASELCLYILSR